MPSDLPAPPPPDTPQAAILAAARTLFAERGFAAASTRRIAEAAGVNLAMIHYYFGNKEQLYQQVVEQEIADLFRLIGKALTDVERPQDVLPSLPRLVMELHTRHPELRRIMMREMSDGAPRLDGILRDLGENGPLGLRHQLTALIEVAGPGAAPPGVAPAHVLALIFAMGHGLMAFAPLLEAVLGLDLADPATAADVGDAAGNFVRRALAPAEEAS